MKITPKQIKAVFASLHDYDISKDDLYEFFEHNHWGYGEVDGERRISIKNLEQWQVHELFNMIKSGAIGSAKYEGSHRGPDMTSNAQMRYAEFLFYHYSKMKFESTDEWQLHFYKWLTKYQKVDDLRFCKSGKATKVITALEHMFITTFGVEEFNILTDKKWVLHSKKFEKYNKEAHHAQNNS